MQLLGQSVGKVFTVLAVPAALWLTFGGAASSSARTATSDDYIFVDGFESRDCSQPPLCSTPASGKSCITGQLTDIATTEALRAVFNIGLTCGHGAIGGPCDLTLGAHDVVSYATNPAGDPALTSGGTVVDGCGRFRFSDLTVPSSGFVAIAVADAPGSDGHMPTAGLRPLGANQQVDGVGAVVAESTTVTAWSLLGQTDFSSGAILLSYSTGGTATAGVTVSHSGSVGALRYFSDTDTQRLLVDSAATSTGANGSALVVNAPFQTYSGIGGESDGCVWTSANMVTIQGVIVSVELVCVL